MITPTIGRIVLVHRPGKSDQPEPAIICYVHSYDRINVGGFDKDGEHFKLSGLYLEGGDETKLDQKMPYAFWMPYQKSVAGRY